MSTKQTPGVFETLSEAGHAVIEEPAVVALTIAIWCVVHSVFVYAIRTKRTLDRQAFLTRSVTASVIGFAFSTTTVNIVSADDIKAHPLWMFLSLFMIWQTYLIYLGIQRTNRIGISKWWNLLISIPATNNIFYLLVIFFWRDKETTDDHSAQAPVCPEIPSTEVGVTEIPSQKLAN